MASTSISATDHHPSEPEGSVSDTPSSDEPYYAAERSPIDDFESGTALYDQGICIPQAHVNSVQDDDERAYEMRWRGHLGRALGLNSQVTLPRRRLWLDTFPHPFVVMNKEPNRLLLQRTMVNGVGYFAPRQSI